VANAKNNKKSKSKTAWRNPEQSKSTKALTAAQRAKIVAEANKRGRDGKPIKGLKVATAKKYKVTVKAIYDWQKKGASR
jgi:hypothetical protein